MRHPAARGVALIEALMALAVMAFGLLAIVGVQATLRQNADLARQRSEATRIAQEEIERWRGYTALGGTDPVVYNSLQNSPATLVSPEYGLSAQFSLATTVTAAANPTTPPDFSFKSLTVDVTWKDRNGEDQRVRLSTALHGVAPEFAGTLSVMPEGSPTSLPGGRNQAIPWDAVRLENGTQSAWRPPQTSSDTVVWKFSNSTGLIVSICQLASNLALTASNLANASCDDSKFAQLLSGFVNFADSSVQATAFEAVAPTGTAQPVQVYVQKTAPVNELVSPNAGCFTEAPVPSQHYVAYYCAVPVSANANEPRTWSGYSYVTGTTAVPLPSHLTVCRYTRYRDDRAVNATPSIANNEHPRAYYQVEQPLTNQSFLVVGVFTDPDPTGLNCPTGSPLPADKTTYPQPSTAP